MNNLKSKDISAHADAEAEIAAKKAYLAKMKVKDQLDKEKAENDDYMFKLDKFHIQEDKELKKLVMKEKFDDWFDALFKRLYTEMFGEDGQINQSFLSGFKDEIAKEAGAVENAVVSEAKTAENAVASEAKAAEKTVTSAAK